MGCTCTKLNDKAHEGNICTPVLVEESLSPSYTEGGRGGTPSVQPILGGENDSSDHEDKIDTSHNTSPRITTIEVREEPPTVTLVRGEDSRVDVKVEDLADMLASKYSVSIQQAKAALRWSNYDSDEAAAILSQTAEIAECNDMKDEAETTKNRTRERLLSIFSNPKTSQPRLLLAEMARMLLAEPDRQKAAKKRAASDAGLLLHSDNRYKVPRQQLSPKSKRSAYFASICDVRSISTDSPSVPPLKVGGNEDQLDIISQSSMMGRYIMPPWAEQDPDVANNFWIDGAPLAGGIPAPPPHITSVSLHQRAHPSVDKRSSGDSATQISVSDHGLPPVSTERIDLTLQKSSEETPPALAAPTYRLFSASQSGAASGATVGTTIAAGTNPYLGTAAAAATSTKCTSVELGGWDQLSDGKWTDPEGGIALSSKQQAKIHAWKRITELTVPTPTVRDGQGRRETGGPSNVTGPDGRMLEPGEPLQPVIIEDRPRARSIRQGFVGDCSFLSSLASLAEYESRIRAPIISSLIFPQRVETTSDGRLAKVKPLVNPHGLYACKLHFNGISRKVMVDDFVPVRSDGKLLAAHSCNRREMWVTILEKAFVKLMGGSYFLHGSNPGSDLYHLTGWIPETIPFRRDVHTGSPELHMPVVTGGEESIQLAKDARWDVVWSQLHQNWIRGACVACLGTSEVADAAPSGLDFVEGVSVSSGIVARHAYSVLSVKEVDGHKLLYVRNPWAVIRWKGRFSPGDSAWTPRLERALGYDSRAAVKMDNGSFWIEWIEVVRWFSHLYLCWNPIFFRYHGVAHSKWGRTPHLIDGPLVDDSHNLTYNPQFCLQVAPIIIENPRHHPNDEVVELWVLLSRHVRDRKRDLFHKYIAIHIYRGGRRVTCPHQTLQHGVYSNGECALIRVLVKRARVHEMELDPHMLEYWNNLPEQQYPGQWIKPITSAGDGMSVNTTLNDNELVLVVSQYSQKSPFNFTINVFCGAPVGLREIEPLFPEDEWTTFSVKGEWQVGTAGGCSNSIWDFMRNPHHRLVIPRRCRVHIFLETEAEISVNLRLIPGLQSTARALRTGRAMTSGPYRGACCLLQGELEAGYYTLVPSSFVAGECAPYVIRVHCSVEPTEYASCLKDNWSMRSPGFISPSYASFPNPRRPLMPTLFGTATAVNMRPLLEPFPILSLTEVPTPFSFPPPPYFSHVTLSSLNDTLFGVYKLGLQADRTNISIRLRVTPQHISSSQRVTMSLLYVMRASHPALRNYAAGGTMSACGLTALTNSEVSALRLPVATGVPVALIKKSDLEGGLSESGRTPSSAAAQLYRLQSLVTIAHAEVFESSLIHGYYMVLVHVVGTESSYAKGKYDLTVIGDKPVTLSYMPT